MRTDAPTRHTRLDRCPTTNKRIQRMCVIRQPPTAEILDIILVTAPAPCKDHPELGHPLAPRSHFRGQYPAQLHRHAFSEAVSPMSLQHSPCASGAAAREYHNQKAPDHPQRIYTRFYIVRSRCHHRVRRIFNGILRQNACQLRRPHRALLCPNQGWKPKRLLVFQVDARTGIAIHNQEELYELLAAMTTGHPPRSKLVPNCRRMPRSQRSKAQRSLQSKRCCNGASFLKRGGGARNNGLLGILLALSAARNPASWLRWATVQKP